MKRAVLLLAAHLAVAGAGELLVETVHLPDPHGGVTAPRFAVLDPTDSILIVGGEGGCLVVISCSTLQRLARVSTGGDAGPLCYASRDNRVFAAVGETLAVVDCTSWEVVDVVDVGCDVQALCYNSQDNKVYCGGVWNDSVAILDGSSHSILGRICVEGQPNSLVYNPLHNKVYCANYVDQTIWVLDGKEDCIVSKMETGVSADFLYFDPVRGRVFSAPREGRTIVVLDGASDSILAKVESQSRTGPLCYNPQDNRLYFGWGFDSLGVLDCSTFTIVSWLHAGPRHFMVHTSRHNRLLVANSWRDEMAVFDCLTDSLVDVVTGSRFCSGVLYNPRSDHAYVLREEGTVAVLDGATAAETKTIPLGGRPTSLACSPRSGFVYCGTDAFHGVSVIDGETHDVVELLDVGPWPRSFCFDTRRNTVYCASTGAITVIDGTTHAVKAVVELEGGWRSLCFNPNSDRVYALGHRSGLAVIDCATNEVLARVDVPAFGRPELILDPIGNRIVCATHEANTVVVVDDATMAVDTILDTGEMPLALCYNTRDKKVYCANFWSSCVTVIDAASSQVLTQVDVGDRPQGLCYNTRENKVYCVVGDVHGVAVIDGSSDSVLTRLDLGHTSWGAICYHTRDNLIYCNLSGTVAVLDCAADTLVAVDSVGPHARKLCYNPKTHEVYSADWGSSSVSVLRSPLARAESWPAKVRRLFLRFGEWLASGFRGN